MCVRVDALIIMDAARAESHDALQNDGNDRQLLKPVVSIQNFHNCSILIRTKFGDAKRRFRGCCSGGENLECAPSLICLV
jgi:hypothetical protein